MDGPKGRVMGSWLIDLISVSYACVGVVNVFAYWPTIKDLYRLRKPSANMASYAIWTVASLITLLYSIFILPDMLFRAVSLMNFIACAMVLVLCLGLRVR